MQSRDQVRAAYDAVAAEYAARFSDELSDKPLDRELLDRFAQSVRPRGMIYDLGCGPGQTTAFLHGCGVAVRGLDLSPALVREARRRNSSLEFAEGDMLALPLVDGTAAGVVAFYAIVHFSESELAIALAEMYRVLEPGGRLLIAFHVGDEVVHVADFLGKPVALDFRFFSPGRVVTALETVGFTDTDVMEREP